MPKKSATVSTTATTTAAPPTATTTTKGSAPGNIQQTVLTVIQNYQKTTPQRTILLDAFLAFIAVVGAIQFVYCVLAGNFVCLFSSFAVLVSSTL